MFPIATSNDPDAVDIRRRFDAIVSGREAVDATALADVLALRPQRQARPELRRPPLPGLQTFRIRISLNGSEPEIWRRLDLRSDLTLNVVHQAIQSAFGWWDYHLSRFTLGGDAWDRTGQVFACKEDLDEADVDDEAILDALVRLDETVQDPGDVLHYVYDYGDNWQLTLVLEEALGHVPGTPSARCVGGERAAPPEDCGHLVTDEELSEVLDDPAHFSLDEVNAALQQSFMGLVDLGLAPALVDLVSRLRLTEVGDDVTARAIELALDRPAPTDDEWRAALRAHLWLLERADGEGIALTAAGYLPPADVMAVAPLVPAAADWLPYGTNNRESQLLPLLEFRQSLQKLGLLRKAKGRLLLTKAGRAARADITVLRRQLVERLGRFEDDPWTTQATLLVLLYAATSPDADIALDDIASGLRMFGWQDARGPVQGYHLHWVEALGILQNVSAEPSVRHDRNHISREAAALARAVLVDGQRAPHVPSAPPPQP